MTKTSFPIDSARRKILGGLVSSAVLSVFPLPSLASSNGTREFSLKAEAGTASILGGKWGNTPVLTYSGQTPGPVLRVRQGERVKIHVENALTEPTTVHWHGLRIPIDMDGVPNISQFPIQPGKTFTYDFVVPDAGTFWYHPHVNSSQQIARGLNGVLIVEEKIPPSVDRDVLWILDDWRLNQDATISEDFAQGHDIAHGGRLGNLITINGKVPDVFSVQAGERIRLRLANVANARIFGLRFDGFDSKVIAIDGQPVEPHDIEDGQLIIGPGQRIDLILDATRKPGDHYTVTDTLYPDEAYALIDVVYEQGKPIRTKAPGPVPALAANPISEIDLATATRHTITIEGGAMGQMKGATYQGKYLNIQDLVKHKRVWALNGVAAHTTSMPPIFELKRGSTYVITVRNDTGWPHPMHLHGHSFRILSFNGKATPFRPWADTVLLPPNEQAEIAFVADNPGDWLFHCHILEHIIGGMLSVMRVT